MDKVNCFHLERKVLRQGRIRGFDICVNSKNISDVLRSWCENKRAIFGISIW